MDFLDLRILQLLALFTTYDSIKALRELRH